MDNKEGNLNNQPLSYKKDLLKGLIVFVVYMAGLSAFLLYMYSGDKKWRADYNARAEQWQKEHALLQAQAAQEAAQAGAQGAYRSERSPFDIAPVQVQQGRAPSTVLFERAARQEAGPQQQKQVEQLDYAAQVAAYEAQLKAQEDARLAAQAREKARQEALAKQQAAREQRQQRQQQAVQKTALTTAPGRATGSGGGGDSFGGSGSGFGTGGKAAGFQPK